MGTISSLTPFWGCHRKVGPNFEAIENLAFPDQLLLQPRDGNASKTIVFLNGQRRCRTGGLPHGHPARFHANRRKSDVRRRRGNRNDQFLDRFGNHDPVGNTVGTRDLVKHRQVAFQNSLLARFPLAARETVNWEFTQRDRVVNGCGRVSIGIDRHVMFGQGGFADETSTFANVALPWEMTVVRKLVGRKCVLSGHLAMCVVGTSTSF